MRLHRRDSNQAFAWQPLPSKRAYPIGLPPRLTQRLAWGFFWAMGILAVVILIFIVIYVMVKGLPDFSAEFFLTEPAGGMAGEGGISSVIVSTIWLIATTMAILIPFGLGAAIYLAEYAPSNWLTRLIRYSVELLAGVPSIVFGLFGLAMFVIALQINFSILAGALTLACLLLPFMVRSSEEAMRAVPQSHREAALSLGATKWQVVKNVVVPGAMPGIITGIILCIGGALAESACLFVVMGGSAAMPTSFLAQGRSLAVHVYYLATVTTNQEKALATAAVLIALILVVNLITRWLARRVRARMEGRA